jgi:ribose 5-phosphate isomerase B
MVRPGSSQVTIVLAADHAGHPLKETIKSYLQLEGHDVIDVKPGLEPADDYPSIMADGAKRVLQQQAVGIFFGGSGNGEAMAANRFPGIRAALCTSAELAVAAREHNDANVLCLGARFVDPGTALEIVDAFLETSFEGGRHEKRVAALDSLNA